MFIVRMCIFFECRGVIVLLRGLILGLGVCILLVIIIVIEIIEGCGFENREFVVY